MDFGSGRLRGISDDGACVSVQACGWLASLDDEAAHDCFYEDGTSYVDGRTLSESCLLSEAGTLCGPECGGCGDGRVCVGVSERSGLGLCAPEVPGAPPARCGSGYPRCDAGEGCLGFVLPDDVTTVDPQRPFRACVPRSACDDIAARRPDRFRCFSP